MEIKAELNNATEEQKIDFIVTFNHQLGYDIEQEIIGEEEVIDEEGNVTIVYTYNLKAWGYTQEEIKEQEKQRRNNEIENKIKELQEMAIPEILNNHTQNIQIYQNVINSLRDSILE